MDLLKDKVMVANAGDSRAVLCREGTAVDLSVDHKPEDESGSSLNCLRSCFAVYVSNLSNVQ